MNYNFSIKNHRGITEIIFSDSLDQTFQQSTNSTCFLYDSFFEKHIPNDLWSIPIEVCESNKNLDYANVLIKKILGYKFPNQIVSIGGGIVQDLSGFISAILKRGVDWTFIPTTFASQADSCIGSKTSINVGSFKNQLGLFYAPSKVKIIPSFLQSLSSKDLYCGLGEVLHYFMQCPNQENLDLAKQFENTISIGSPSTELLLKLIKESLSIKSSIIQIDEFDKDIRKVFNFGHTFGHAIEAATKNHVPHGIAVLLGIKIALEIAEICNNDLLIKYNSLVEESINHIHDYCRCNFDIEIYKRSLLRDKKNSVDGHIAVVLPDDKPKSPELTIMNLVNLKDNIVFEKSISILQKQKTFDL